MQTAISSTEAVRKFSELLNNIKYRGDRYTVIRGGNSGRTSSSSRAGRHGNQENKTSGLCGKSDRDDPCVSV